MSDIQLVHGTCIKLDGRGIFITGPSGAGKTQTALTVWRRARASGLTCHFVSDDQTHVQALLDPTRLIATCPDAIFGKLEIFGFGIIEDRDMFCEHAELNLLVDLVADENVARMAPEPKCELNGVALAELRVPQKNPELCATAIFAALFAHVRL
ncbi:MAG: serine/threonine protein kinase [Pseudomonadota bacterium]